MRRRSAMAMAMAMAFGCAALLGLLAAGGPAAAAGGGGQPAAASRPDSGASTEWGTAVQAPGIAALSHNGFGQLTSVSCAAAGDCSAGGFYEDGITKNGQAFVIGESGTVWGPAQALPTVVLLNTGNSAIVSTVSCAAPGNCGAAGYYRANDSVHPFVVPETGSVWDGALALPGTGTQGAQALSESCPVPERCSIGGYLTSGSGNNIGFLDDQIADHSWDAALPLPGTLGSAAPADSVAKVMSISCWSPGNCAAGGFYTNGAGAIEAFVVDETNGSWHAAREIAGSLNQAGDAEITGVSCGPAGTCAAVGYYAPGPMQSRPFIVTFRNGSWGSAATVNGIGPLDTGHFSQLTAVSCGPAGGAGNCTAGGIYYRQADASQQPFAVTEKNGSWGAALEVPGIERWNTGKDGYLAAVSCVSPGNCSVAGSYETTDQARQVWVASQHNGTWGAAGTVPGLLALNTAGQSGITGLSCATVGSCGMVGYYYASADHQEPFVATGSVATPTSATLTRSAATVTSGHEQSEKLSVTVTAVNHDTVSGTVRVRAGSALVCSITVSAGHGSCKLAASALKPGTYSLVAQYGPTQEFMGSPSAAKALKVVK